MTDTERTWPTAYLIHGTARAEYGPVTDYFVRSLNGTYTTIGGGQALDKSSLAMAVDAFLDAVDGAA